MTSTTTCHVIRMRVLTLWTVCAVWPVLLQTPQLEASEQGQLVSDRFLSHRVADK